MSEDLKKDPGKKDEAIDALRIGITAWAKIDLAMLEGFLWILICFRTFFGLPHRLELDLIACKQRI